MSNEYFKPLTGIRAVAALMVYFHHYNSVNINAFGYNLHNFVNELHVGVTIFFVLSGFLIASRYFEMDINSFGKYMLNRFARIYPSFFILTIITFILFRIDNNDLDLVNIRTIFLNFTLLKGYFDNYKFTGIPQAWSLTVEETFYIVAPIIFILIRKLRITLLLLPLLITATGVLLVLYFRQHNLGGFFKSFNFLFGYTFFGRCFEFFSGIYLALFYKKHKENLRFSNFTMVGALVVLLSIMSISLVRGNSEYGISQPLGKVVNNLILPLFGITLLLLGLICEKTILSRILSTRIFIVLGKSSYIFYLIHYGKFSEFIGDYTENYTLILFIRLGISILIFRTIEEPLNIFIRKRFIKYSI